MSGIDKIKGSILEDGTIKTSTDQVSAANHSTAEAFLRELTRLTGGAVTRIRKPQVHTHLHTHEHEGH